MARYIGAGLVVGIGLDELKDLPRNIQNVTRASNEAGTAAARLHEAANGLSSQSERLKSEVDGFIASLVAA